MAGGLPEVVVANDTDYVQVNGQILAQAGEASWDYLLSDHLGSVRQVSNGSGAIQLAQDYDPFGGTLYTYGIGSSTFGFTDEQEDESGLLFLRARYYDAGTGRFLSQDSFAGTPETPYSQHPYQYGYGNPVMHTDPSGQCVDVGHLFGAFLPEYKSDMSFSDYLNSPITLSDDEKNALKAEC